MEFGNQLFGQRTAAAFGKHCLPPPQLHAGLVGVGGPAVFADAHIAGGNAFHAAVFPIQHFGGGKAGVNLHAQAFGLLGQPATQHAQANDVVALIVEAGWQGQRQRGLAGEEKQPFAFHRLVERRTALAPIGQQLAQRLGVEHRARQNMRAHFRAFFHHAHADVITRLSRELLEPYRRRQPGHTRAHDYHVILHTLARCLFCHICQTFLIAGRFCPFPY